MNDRRRDAIDELVLRIKSIGPQPNMGRVRDIDVADALKADGWRPPARVIQSRTQLSLMPIGTVVRRTHPGSKYPEVFERQEQGFSGWALASGHGQMSDSDDIVEPGWTVTVLHEPEEGQ